MSDTVQQVKDKLDIIDVISAYTELHKAGKNFKGKSPFSPEKTPSFYVSPDQGLYYCFSTNQGGDMFTFIQTIEGVDFKEALKILADKAGVEIVREDPKTKGERDQLFSVLDTATSYFTKELENESDATTYLEQRGVTKETQVSWRLGYAPGPPNYGWRHLYQHLKEKGFTEAEIRKAGLIKDTTDGKEPYDVFRDRIMFPMANPTSKIVAFSGRILHSDSEAPKYVNSPETELYKKSELLYGYHRAKDGIRKLDFSLIVEGQFDVVMCHQAGFTNTVAVSGTALTPLHVRLLERLSSNVLLALDADRAGISAMKRSAEIMLPRGMDVKVAHMEDGKDPADVVKEGVPEFRAIVKNATHIVEFLIDHIKKSTDDARTFKLKARSEIIPLIALIPNKIDQDHFISVFAEGINTTKDAVRYEVEDAIAKLNVKTKTEYGGNIEKPKAQASELKSDFQQIQKLAEYLIAASTVLGTHGPELKEVLEKINNVTNKKLELSLSPEQLSQHVFTFSQYIEKEPIKMVLGDLKHKLLYLETAIIKQQLQEKRKKLETAELSQEQHSMDSILSEISTLQKLLSAERQASYIYSGMELD